MEIFDALNLDKAARGTETDCVLPVFASRAELVVVLG